MTLRPAPQVVPPGQPLHGVGGEPAGQKNPTAHALLQTALAPPAPHMTPAAHAVHAAPHGETLPDAHAQPAVHGVRTTAVPATQPNRAGQVRAVRSPAPGVPDVDFCGQYVPAPQTPLHAAVERVVVAPYVPDGQGVATDDPVGQKWPTPHVMSAARNAPGTGQRYPALQGRHASADAAPVPAAYVPGAQGVGGVACRQ